MSKPKRYLIRICRTVMSEEAKTYLETHDWDDITGTLADGIELAQRLRTSIILENFANDSVGLINPDGTHQSLIGAGHTL